jgi:hypothetical protein
VNDVAEDFTVVHARAQQIPRASYDEVPGRVEYDGEGPGPWVGEWVAAAREQQKPRYMDMTGPWLVLSPLRMRRTKVAQRAVLRALLPMLRARCQLTATDCGAPAPAASGAGGTK